jgi:hypothetical protein
MASFTCEKCGKDILDSPQGYMTGCVHYPLENRTRVHIAPPPSKEKIIHTKQEDDDYNEVFNYG